MIEGIEIYLALAVGTVVGVLMVGMFRDNKLPPKEGRPEREGEFQSAARASAGPLRAVAGRCQPMCMCRIAKEFFSMPIRRN